jgi:hypothetical protein
MNKGPYDQAFLGILFPVVAVLVIFSLIINIFFLLTLSRCLSRVQPRNRDMEPGMVWINLIPCFSMVRRKRYILDFKNASLS